MAMGIIEYADSCKSKPKKSILIRYAQFALDTTESDADKINSLSIDFINQNPHEYIIESYIKYIENIKRKQNLAPGSLNFTNSVIRAWLRRNKVYLNEDEKELFKSLIPKNIYITEDAFLTRDIIKTILTFSDPMLTAYILMLCSSGCRKGELSQLHYSDLKYDEENDVYYFKLRYNQTKSGKPHTYYFSHEAYTAVEEYLKVRSSMIKVSSEKTLLCLKKEPTESDKSLLFPYVHNTMGQKLQNALTKAGLLTRDDNTNRFTIHYHSFRKFADTQFKEAVGINMGNELIGHDEGLSKSYRRYDPADIIAAYKKCEPYVTIQTPPDYVHLKTEAQAETMKLQSLIATQQTQIEDFRKRMEAMETALSMFTKLESEKTDKKRK